MRRRSARPGRSAGVEGEAGWRGGATIPWNGHDQTTTGRRLAPSPCPLSPRRLSAARAAATAAALPTAESTGSAQAASPVLIGPRVLLAHLPALDGAVD